MATIAVGQTQRPLSGNRLKDHETLLGQQDAIGRTHAVDLALFGVGSDWRGIENI
jgi:hypothetical protein